MSVFNDQLETPAITDYMVPAQRRISLNGNMARRLLDTELDVGCMRPYVDGAGNSYITRNQMAWDPKKQMYLPQRVIVPTTNDTNATLRYDDWKQIDAAVVKAAKPRLKAAGDLQAAGLVYNLPNGIAKTDLQSQTQSDISGATVSMDGMRRGESDRPVFGTVHFPIPIIHKDFSFPLRQVLESRTGPSPLDLTTAELAARRVAEQVEQLVLGTTNTALLGPASYSFNASTIYGYMNWPTRITYAITTPTAAGWTPQQAVADVLGMKKASQAAFHFGPWRLYAGLSWDPYMDDDYKATYNGTTLRQRLLDIKDIQAVETVDYIPDYSLLLVQQTTNVVRLVIGMNIITIQWESEGGMELNFKVMCVMVPQLRADFNSNTGIVHGS